jgi:hypothetical protein
VASKAAGKAVGVDQQWARGDPAEAGDGWFYLRRTDDQGRPVVLELHLGLNAGHAVASVHVYDYHGGDVDKGFYHVNLDHCAIRCSVPAREVYEAWLTAGRDAEVVYQALREMEIPDPAPPLPAAAQQRIDDLTNQVARLQRALDAAGVAVNLDLPGSLMTHAAERHARRALET